MARWRFWRKRRNGDATSVSGSDLRHSAVGRDARVYHAEAGGQIVIEGSGVTLHPREIPRSVLPATREECLGRDAELADVMDPGPGSEVCGPFGIGKTNLAKVAAYAADGVGSTVYYSDRAD